jgi:Na+/pantothenate symporter
MEDGLDPRLANHFITIPASPIRDDLLNKDELIPKFGVVNYVVFAAMLLVSAVIGAYFWWRGQKNTEEFLMASRSMGTFPMCLSLIASFMSAITLLGTPAEMYVSGMLSVDVQSRNLSTPTKI